MYNHAQQQRWLWQAVDHATGEVLAYVLSTREDKAFLDLLALLQPNRCQHFYTDGWGTYERHIEQEQHTIGKRYTQNSIAETFELSHSHQALGKEIQFVFRSSK